MTAHGIVHRRFSRGDEEEIASQTLLAGATVMEERKVRVRYFSCFLSSEIWKNTQFPQPP